MADIKIALLYSKKKCPPTTRKEWVLQKNNIYPFGSKAIDLSFDKSFRKLNGRIFHDGKSWQMEITGQESHEIKCGDILFRDRSTSLIVLNPGQEVTYVKGFTLITELAEELNYALIHNRLPFIKDLRIYNTRPIRLGKTFLKIALGQFLSQEYTIPPLKQGESFRVKDFDFYKDIFESRNEFLSLKIFIGQEKIPVLVKEIKLLCANAWLKNRNSYSCTSLASFVLPEHSYITGIAAKAGETSNPESGLKGLYNYFLEKWKIRYLNESLTEERECQKVRLPHHILYDWDSRQGEGNCLDLSLLFASCLENRGFNPVIFIVEVNKELWHAFIGLYPYPHFHPLLKNREELATNGWLIDPLSLTTGASYEQAVLEAKKIFKDSQLIFALDIKSAREYGITPLPFKGTPQESPAAIYLDVKARELTARLNSNYRVTTTLHMLVALLTYGTGFTKRVFETLGLDPKKAAELISKGLSGIKPPQEVPELSQSENYKQLLPRATQIAMKKESLFVQEEHLLQAILEINSSSLDSALKDLGSGRSRLLNTARGLDSGAIPEESFKSFYNGNNFYMY